MAATSNADIYLEWDIMYETFKTKKQRDKIIKDLLYKIESSIKVGAESIPLKHKVFKSETNKLLYILRIYKKAAIPDESKSSVNTAQSDTMASAADIDSPDSSLAFSGPIRPSGPPKPPPPGISITEINLNN